jgi:chemotaxis protein methyltransferase CheR
VRIHASDVDSCFATQVGEGIFPESELRRLPTGFREKYFRPLDASNTFGVIDEIRSKIFFTHHDLLSLDPLQKNFSLVVCKNVLLHFNDQQRRDVLRMFHSALRLEGVLVTEHTQKMPAELGQMYRQLVRHAQVYAKEPGSAMPKFRKDEPANVGRPHFMKNAIESKPKKKPFEKNAGETA